MALHPNSARPARRWSAEGLRWQPTAAVLPLVAAALLLLLTPLAALAARTVSAASADPFDSGRYAFRLWRDVDGLPQNTVHALALDRRGMLWVGTQDGAAYYDGRSWTPVNPPTHLQSNFVRSLLASQDGSVWLGTQAAGLCRLDDDTWTVFAAELPHLRINALAEGRSGDGTPVVWVATHGGGVARWLHGRWTTFDTHTNLPANTVWALLPTTDETGTPVLWVGTEAGLASLREGASQFVVEPGLPSVSVNSLLETGGGGASGTLWVGTYGAGVFRRRGATWQRIDRGAGLPSNYVTSLAADPGTSGDWTVWVGTDGGGLAQVRDTVVAVVTAESGLPSNAVYSLLHTTAEQGTAGLWVGTRNGGLGLLKEGQWRQFSPLGTRPTVPVTALLESRSREGALVMWFGTDGGGVVRCEGRECRTYDRSSGALPDDTVQSLLETEEESGERALWVGTRHGGVARFRGHRWTTFDTRSGALPNDMVQALFASRSSDGSLSVWVGTRAGLARFSGGRWEQFDRTHGLPGESVLCFAPSGTLHPGPTFWIGTSAGLARWNGQRFEPLDIGFLPNQAVQALLETREGAGREYLWIGTDGGGVTRLSLTDAATTFLTLTTDSDPPLPNNTIYDIVQDPAGRLYLLTNGGVARISPNLAATAGASPLEVSTFTVHDGLPSNQGNRGAALVDAQGRVWVGTVLGAAAFDPSQERVDRASKKIWPRSSLASDGTPLLPHAVLGHRHSSVAFQFALLSFFREDETRYRTQLLPIEEAPSPWTAAWQREYPLLPAGDYVFRVWGRDWAGNVSGPVELPFVVRPAPWRSWWFALLVAAVVAGSATVLVWARIRVHLRREQQLATLVDARTRELREANELLLELSYLDPLTGVANRRRFEERLATEWQRAVRTGSLLSVGMIDIDHFKLFNDTYGHHRGDECLRAVASALADGLPRVGDSVARYGGEEFALILPATDRLGALTVAESLRRRVEALEIASPTGGVVTISCGVATTWPTLEQSPAQLVELADRALYRAKQAGRNTSRAEETELVSSSHPVLPRPPSR